MKFHRLADFEVRRLPGFFKLSVNLSTLLDPEQPLGNDFRLVLEYLGFYPPEISFLASRYPRPTLEALKSWRGSTAELVEAFRLSEREDAINCLRVWLGQLAGYGRNVKDLTGPENKAVGQWSNGNSYRLLPSLASHFPSIEELLEQRYQPKETKRQTSDSFVVQEEECRVRQTSEYLCNTFTSFVTNCFVIPKDATWLTSSTVYVNNFARVYCFILILVNLVDCVCSSKHCPSYWLEFIISLLPVMESFYVDKHIDSYKSAMKRLVECESEVCKLQNILERSVSRQTYDDLQSAKSLYETCLNEVQPKYTDLRLCVFSTLFVESFIATVLILRSLLFDTLQTFHERLGNGFTAIAYSLLIVDCFYNAMVVLLYYGDSTPRTVLRKDRFRHRQGVRGCVVE